MNPIIVSQERLKTIAGEQRFREGLQRSERIAVENFAVTKDATSGKIEHFQVKLNYRGDGVEGACSCPESDGFEFCCHCVQLALHANKVAQQLLSLSKGPDKSKVLAYLLSLDKQALAKQMLELLEQDTKQFKRFLLKASLDSESFDYSALKAEVTQLTRLQEKLFSQRQVKHFFSRIERFLEELQLSNYLSDPDAMLKVIEYAFVRINKLLDQVDDRAGQSGDAIALLQTLYQHLLAALEGRPDTLAKRLEKTWQLDKHQLLGLDLAVYFDAQPLRFSAFLTRLENRWLMQNELVNEGMEKESIKTVSQGIPPPDYLLKKLARNLLTYRVKSLNLDQAQAMRQYLARSAEEYISVAELWVQEDETQRAVAVLEAALNEQPGHELLVAKLVELADAMPGRESALFALFKRYPMAASEALFSDVSLPEVRLTEAPFNASDQKTIELQAIDILFARAKCSADEYALLLRLLLNRARFDEALGLLKKVKFSLDQRIELAERIEAVCPEQSVDLRQAAISELLDKGIGKADQRAAALLVCLEQAFGAKQDFSTFVDSLRPKMRLRPGFQEHYNRLTASPLD